MDKKEAVKAAVAHLDAAGDQETNLWGFLTERYPDATSDEKLSVFVAAWNVIDNR